MNRPVRSAFARLARSAACMPARPVRWTALICSTLLCFAAAAGSARAQLDPGLRGPFTPAQVDYDFGDRGFALGGFPGPIELRARVHHPLELERGPFPLVVVLHGRHVTCFNPATLAVSQRWPCSAPLQPVPSHLGYDYIGQTLASQGFVVVSISANGINAVDSMVADAGARARAELIQRHLQLFQTFTTSGAAPLGTRFVGRIDLQRVGTFGHSRGGEGVVRHQQLNTALGSPFGIRAVLPVAPTDFSRFVINRVPLGVMLPYCDGDVNDLQGVHYYDDSLYNLPGDPARKHTFLIQGANHNFFNTVWTPGLFPAGAVDDWVAFVDPGGADPHCGPGRVDRRTSAQQRAIATAYTSAFFRTYLGSESAFLPILTGLQPAPASAQPAVVFASHQPPDTAADRRTVNRYAVARDRMSNQLGGGVTQSGLSTFTTCGGPRVRGQNVQCLPGQPTARQPHTAPSSLSRAPGLGQLQLGWSSPAASLTNAIPAASRDVSGYGFVQFRAALNFADTRNPVGVPSDFRVELRDTTGRAAGVPVSRFSGALFFPPGVRSSVPKVFLDTIQIPLSAFTGVDLANLASVSFAFDQRTSGALLIADLAFTNPTGVPSLP
jgi:hypothetical protein